MIPEAEPRPGPRAAGKSRRAAADTSVRNREENKRNKIGQKEMEKQRSERRKNNRHKDKCNGRMEKIKTLILK